MVKSQFSPACVAAAVVVVVNGTTIYKYYKAEKIALLRVGICIYIDFVCTKTFCVGQDEL